MSFVVETVCCDGEFLHHLRLHSEVQARVQLQVQKGDTEGEVGGRQ